jgi:hypothetical protein
MATSSVCARDRSPTSSAVVSSDRIRTTRNTPVAISTAPMARAKISVSRTRMGT